PRRRPTIWATWPPNLSPPIGIIHLVDGRRPHPLHEPGIDSGQHRVDVIPQYAELLGRGRRRLPHIPTALQVEPGGSADAGDWLPGVVGVQDQPAGRAVESEHGP